MNTAANNLVSAFWVITLGTIVLGAEPAPTPPPVAGADTNTIGPRIQFQTPVYNFGKASAGRLVKYTYVFTNTGNQVLEVTAVQPSCNCTIADDWTHRVEPGQTGVIPVQFDSKSTHGVVLKSFLITSNDKRQPTTEIKLTGTVGGKPFDVNPPVVYFNVVAEAASNAPAVVHITNNMEAALTVFTPESDSRAFTAQLKTNEPGRNFELLITPMPPLSPGGIQGHILLKTSVTEVPAITITAVANVQPAITVVPAQIVLPPAPLLNNFTLDLTIQYSGTSLLKLSHPVVNAKGVKTRVKEVQPGHIFAVSLTFPQGFEIPSSPSVEFTIKSSHPQYPVLRARIIQTPRPTVPTP